MAKIYKITNNITNKVYIGKTIRETLDQRYKEHISAGRKIEHSSLISKSLREYGTINHNIELLEECADHDVLIKEQYWIDAYDSLFLGYNIKNEFIEDTERKYWGDSNKAKENISKGIKWNKGISPKESTREKISKTKKKKYELGLYENSFGHKHTEETKKKLSDIAKNRPKPSSETKQKLGNQSKDRKFYYSVENKRKILIKSNQLPPEGYMPGKGTCWVHKNAISISIDIWEKQNYINNGFKEGRLIKCWKK